MQSWINIYVRSYVRTYTAFTLQKDNQGSFKKKIKGELSALTHVKKCPTLQRLKVEDLLFVMKVNQGRFFSVFFLILVFIVT